MQNKSDGSQLLKNAEGYGEYVALAVLSDSVATSDTVTLTEDNIGKLIFYAESCI